MFKFKWSIAVPAGVLVFCAAWGVAEWRRHTVQNQLDAPSEIGFSDSGIADYADTVISHVIPPEMRIVNVIRVFQNMTYQKVSEQITLLRLQEEVLRLQQEQQEREAGVPDRQPNQDYPQVYPPTSTPVPTPAPTPAPTLETETEPEPMPTPLPPSAGPDNECWGAPTTTRGGTRVTCPELRNYRHRHR